MKTKRVNFSIPEDVDNALLNYSTLSLISKSKIISKLIKYFLQLSEEEKKKDKTALPFKKNTYQFFFFFDIAIVFKLNFDLFNCFT